MKLFLFLLNVLILLKPAAVMGEGSAAGVSTMTFGEAVEKGLSLNLDLLAARYNISIAEADELTAGLLYNPALSFNASLQPFNGNWNQTNSGGPGQRDLILSYPLDLTGKIGKARKSASEAVRVSRARFQDTVRLKALELRFACVNVMAAQQTVALSQEKAQNLRRLVQLIQARIGRQDILPLLQARANLALDQVLLDSRQSENALSTAKAALARLMGLAPGSPAIEITTKLRDFEFGTLPDRSYILEQALSLRPDLSALRQARLKLQRDRNLARAQSWDNIGLNLGYTTQGRIAAKPGDPALGAIPSADSWLAGLSVPLPLFNRNQGNILKTGFSIEQADRQIEALQSAVTEEVNTIYSQLEVSRELIREYETKQLRNAQSLRDAQQKMFGTGAHGILEYLDAVGAYSGTLSSYYGVVADYRRNAARMNAAVGKDIMP